MVKYKLEKIIKYQEPVGVWYQTSQCLIDDYDDKLSLIIVKNIETRQIKYGIIMHKGNGLTDYLSEVGSYTNILNLFIC